MISTLLLLLLMMLSRFSRVRLCATPETAAHQAPCPWDSPGKNTGVGCHFLLQCMKVKSESEVTQSCSAQQPHGLQPTRLLCPWDFSRKEYWSGLPDHHPDLSLVISHLSLINKLQLIHNFMISHDMTHDLV